MVEALIKNVRAAEQSVIAYWKKLKPHYTGHEEAPLWMACLAAFPVAVTIDLLYQLWANFRLLKDKDGNEYQLPPLVVNDCILSPLFSITGKDLFEMPADTRAFLLNVLRQRFGDELMTDLASFLYKYIREKRSGKLPGNFYDAQEWTALLTVDPQQAAMNILSTLKNKLDEENQLESIGVANLLTALVKENQNLADMMRQALDKVEEPVQAGNEFYLMAAEEPATYKTQRNIHIRPATAGSGAHIEIPAGLSSSLMPLYEMGKTEGLLKEGLGQKKGVVYAVIVGGEPGEKGKGLVNACMHFSRFLIDKRLVDVKNMHLLTGAEATHATVTETLRKVLLNASTEDTILFYFKGHVTFSQTTNYLMFVGTRHYDSSPDGISGGLSSSEFREVINRYAANDPAVITIVDSNGVGLESWGLVKRRKFILLSSGETTSGPKSRMNSADKIINLLTFSPQNLTYKEIISRLFITNKQLPGTIIQTDYIDDYFLTDTRKDKILQKQELLKDLGFNVTVDGRDGSQYQKELFEFMSRYSLQPEVDLLKELQSAFILKDEPRVKVYYLTIHKKYSEDAMFIEDYILPAIKDRIQKEGWATVKYSELPNLQSNVVAENVIECHLILIGLNSDWINDRSIIQSVLSLLNLAYALNKKVQFIFESNIDWKTQSIIRDYTVHPSSFTPVTQERGMNEMLQELEATITHLQRYLRPKPEQPNNPEIERRIRIAQQTMMLDLSNLTLHEIPPAVFQLEGLQSMDISANKITSIPGEIRRLQSLHRLNLADNPIEELPEEIGNLFQLEELNLRGTNLHQLPRSIGQPVNLNTLYIDQTNIRVLNVGAFKDRIPHYITYGYPGLLNLPPSGSVKRYFKPVHTKEFAIIEIHSENASSRYNTVPKEVADKVYYRFQAGVNTLHQLFKIIYTGAGTHTIIYLCDEHNILSPQFGAESERHHLIYQYFQAFGKPLNLIINNPELYSGAFPDLTGTGELNFVAVRDGKSMGKISFAQLFFEKIWQLAGAAKSHNIYLGFSSSSLQDDENKIENFLWDAGCLTIKSTFYEGINRVDVEQIDETVSWSDITILIIKNRLEDRGHWLKSTERFISQHYRSAQKRGKRILVFLHNDLSGLNDSYVKTLLIKYPALQFMTRFSRATELIKKIHSVLGSLILLKQDSNRRISLSDTLENLEILNRDGMKLGYSVFVNYENLKDFSLPIIKTRDVEIKPIVKKTGPKKAKTPASKSAPAQQRATIKAFKGKWVLVIGTGNKARVTKADRLCARAIGEMLATEGYGVISSGWYGIDFEICQAFESVYKLNKVSVRNSLLQVLGPDQRKFTNGAAVKVENDGWNKYALDRAMAVVIIGGSTLTLSSYIEARKNDIPVVPIPGTGGVADSAHKTLLNEKKYKYFYSKQLLRRLEGVIETKVQAEDLALSVLNILQKLTVPRISNNKPAVNKKPVSKNAKLKPKTKPIPKKKSKKIAKKK